MKPSKLYEALLGGGNHNPENWLAGAFVFLLLVGNQNANQGESRLNYGGSIMGWMGQPHPSRAQTSNACRPCYPLREDEEDQCFLL
jgi:hypothetical protein